MVEGRWLCSDASRFNFEPFKTSVFMFFYKHNAYKHTQPEIKGVFKRKLSITVSLGRLLFFSMRMLRVTKVWLDWKLMWDNVYHKSMDASVFFKYNLKAKGNECQKSLLLIKKDNVFRTFFKFLFKKHLSRITYILWNTSLLFEILPLKHSLRL